MRRLVILLALLGSLLPAGLRAAPVVGTSQDLAGAWRFAPGDDVARAQPAFDDSSWTTMATGSGWTPEGKLGFGWYRRTVNLDPAVVSEPKVQLHVSHGQSNIWAYVNGHLAGVTSGSDLVADVPHDWITDGTNVFAVRVYCPASEFIGYEACGITGAVTLDGSSTDRTGLPLTLTSDRVGNITEPGVPLTLRARTINTTTAPLALTASFGPLGSSSATVAPGAEHVFTAPSTSATRGPSTATVTLSDSAGAIRSATLGIGVADAPGPADDRFATNIIQDMDVATARGTEGLAGMDLAARAGATTIREHLIPWADAQPEPNTAPQWDLYDAVYANATRAGLKVLWNVHRVPYWSLNLPSPSLASNLISGLQHPPLPSHYDEFCAFFAAAAQRFPGGLWEIGNEPDGDQPQYITLEYGLEDHKAYLSLLKQCFIAIKAADPTATVVLGGMQRPDDRAIREAALNPMSIFGGAPSFFERVMDEMRKDGPTATYFDVMNFHAYREDAASDGYRIQDRMVKIQALVAKYHLEALPLWNTETNNSPPSDDSSRIATVRNFVVSVAAGVDRVFYFHAVDYPDEADALPWGWFDKLGQPRQSFFAHAALRRAVGGLPYAGQVGSAYRFSDGTRTTDVYWSDTGTTVTVPLGATVRDDFGNDVAHSGSVTIGPHATYVLT